MTMLDRMRRHKSWLKWSLAIVVLTFVLLYIPDFVQTKPTGTGAGAREVVAEINGRTVPLATSSSATSRRWLRTASSSAAT